jgi:hypothetical protein
MVPAETDQVTPEFVPSFATVAVNPWVSPPERVAAVGVMETDIGVSVTVALADLLVSDLLTAVTVAVPVTTGEGAVYRPAADIVPDEADQVTPALEASFVTVAANVCVAPPAKVTDAGLTATLIGDGGGVPCEFVPPEHPASKPRKKRGATIRRNTQRYIGRLGLCYQVQR